MSQLGLFVLLFKPIQRCTTTTEQRSSSQCFIKGMAPCKLTSSDHDFAWLLSTSGPLSFFKYMEWKKCKVSWCVFVKVKLINITVKMLRFPHLVMVLNTAFNSICCLLKILIMHCMKNCATQKTTWNVSNCDHMYNYISPTIQFQSSGEACPRDPQREDGPNRPSWHFVCLSNSNALLLKTLKKKLLRSTGSFSSPLQECLFSIRKLETSLSGHSRPQLTGTRHHDKRPSVHCHMSQGLRHLPSTYKASFFAVVCLWEKDASSFPGLSKRF